MMSTPNHGINHVLSYGQSLSNGWGGLPPLSTVAAPGALMLGRSVRAMAESSVRWQSVGEPRLQPLLTTAQVIATGEVLDATTRAAIQPDQELLGETILEGALNLWCRRAQRDGEANTRMLASACGVGGQSIEALSWRPAPCLFDRLADCVRLARAASLDAGHTYALAALAFLQGEGNNWGAGGTSDGTEYKALLERLRQDFQREIVATAAGQSGPVVPWFLHQTGGAYSSVTNSIPQAQWEFCAQTADCHMVAPVYPLTESRNGHLDANGYRWLGAYFGKVMHKVISRGETWHPLSPRAASVQGQEIRIGFHVPVPPLVWEHPIAGHDRIAIWDAGFELWDEAGEVGIAQIGLAGTEDVIIVAARQLGSGAFVRYAGQNRRGRGCLHDSDPDIADDVFVHDPAAGAHAGNSLRNLVGRPYPLVNWCVAFTISLGS